MSASGTAEVATAGAAPPLNRMAIALLSLIGLFIAAYMLFVKLGWIGTLICGVGGSCDTVQASRWAVFLGVPVPAWGVAGYALILAVAVVGVSPRWAGDGRVGRILVALTGVAFAFSMYLTALEAFVIRAWCRWCVVSAIVATLLFILSLVELRRGARRGVEVEAG